MVELLLVFCLLWYIADFLFVYAYNLSLPDHRSLRHVWQLSLGEYPDTYSQYREEENTGEAREANFERILRTLQDYPGIEAVAVIDDSSEPGGGSFWGGTAFSAEDSARYVSGQIYYLSPRYGDFFRVFSYTTNNGKQPVSVADFDINNPNSIVLGQLEADYLFPDGQAKGKQIDVGGHSCTVIGVVDNVKRFDYQRLQNIFYRFDKRWSAGELRDAKIVVRTRMNTPAMEAFKKEMSERLQTGNFYLKNIVPQAAIAGQMKELFGVDKDIRVRVYLMAFFLLNILLCVMGTFWYRINIRKEEIGIRKALGSSSAGIRNTLVLEGLCLLTLAMLPALLIELNIVYAGLLTTMGRSNGNDLREYLIDNATFRFLITNAVTWVILAVIIIIAISIPARKAADIMPAEVLHAE